MGAFVKARVAPGTRTLEGRYYHAPEIFETYALDGTLLSARTMSEVPGFDRADYPLNEAALATWDGFVLVSLRASPSPSKRRSHR